MRNTLILLVGGVLIVGCDVEEDGADEYDLVATTEIADQSAESRGCDVEFGRTFIFARFEIMGFGLGHDLDGDGTVDNALAVLSGLANDGWRDSIATGAMMYMFDFTPWMDDASAWTDDANLDFFTGIDVDEDPSNNTGGEGRFMVPAEQFDVACNPTSRFEDVVMEDVTLTGGRELWSFFLPAYGTMEFHDLDVRVDVAPDMSSMHGTGGAVWTFCSLSRAPFPGPFPGSFLDVMVTGFDIDPDIDRDGDGIEQVIGNGETVVRCIDGDGTEIEDPFCACDPRIVDGYSIAFEAWGVPATIEGIVPASP